MLTVSKKKKLTESVIPKCFLHSFAASPMPEHNIASEDLEPVSEEIVDLNLVVLVSVYLRVEMGLVW